MKLIKKTILFALFTFLASKAFAVESPIGLWKTIDDVTGQPKAIVEISATSSKTLTGKILKIFPSKGHSPDELCEACEGSKRNQPIVGMVILENLKQSSENPIIWNNGEILDPKNGKTYHCNIQLAEAGKKLNVRGYIGLPLFGRTQTWIKANSLE